MVLSQTAEYALRAVVFLTDGTEEQYTNQQIADGTRVPSHYLSKVLQALTRAKLVAGQRGIGGGFRLTRDGGKISVLDVINAVDPIQRIETCPLGLKSHGTRLCALHRKLDDGLAMIEKSFATTTIREILEVPSQNHPLRARATRRP